MVNPNPFDKVHTSQHHNSIHIELQVHLIGQKQDTFVLLRVKRQKIVFKSLAQDLKQFA